MSEKFNILKWSIFSLLLLTNLKPVVPQNSLMPLIDLLVDSVLSSDNEDTNTGSFNQPNYMGSMPNYPYNGFNAPYFMNRIPQQQMQTPYGFVPQTYPYNQMMPASMPNPWQQSGQQQSRPTLDSDDGSNGAWQSSSDNVDDNSNSIGQQTMFPQMSQNPYNSVSSSGFQSFSTLGPDGQMHTRTRTW